MIKIHHAQITVPSSAVLVARRFYLEEMQLPEIEKPKALQKNGGFWIQLENIQIHVGVEEGVDRLATKAHLCFEVDNILEWENKLKSLGIKTIPGSGIPNCERFEFRDPCGNRLEILQRI